VTAVATAAGDIACEVVVNCAGMWARALGQASGVPVPLWPVEHFYAVTRPIPGVTPDLAVLRDLDGCVYVREEVGGLLFGGFEPRAKPWTDSIPDDFAFSLLKEHPEQFEVLMRGALERLPVLESAEIQLLLNGPESFTPDGNYILGEAPGLRGYFVAAGFNSGGIASAGGAGRALAEWIVDGVATSRSDGVRPATILAASHLSRRSSGGHAHVGCPRPHARQGGGHGLRAMRAGRAGRDVAGRMVRDRRGRSPCARDRVAPRLVRSRRRAPARLRSHA
jgi:glycine/D-amino acid oxidase-like deaminating enzyme